MKNTIELSPLSTFTSGFTLVDFDKIEVYIKSFSKVELYEGNINIYFNDDLRYGIMSYLYGSEFICKDNVDDFFVDHVIKNNISELLSLERFDSCLRNESSIYHKYMFKFNLFSSEVYIEFKKDVVDSLYVKEFGVDPKRRMNESLIKSIAMKKLIDVDIGLLEQSFDMNTILNLKVGDVIKTNRKKKDGLQILYKESILANNIFISENDTSKLIIG